MFFLAVKERKLPDAGHVMLEGIGGDGELQSSHCLSLPGWMIPYEK
jgi:hypothetical protein